MTESYIEQHSVILTENSGQLLIASVHRWDKT